MLYSSHRFALSALLIAACLGLLASGCKGKPEPVAEQPKFRPVGESEANQTPVPTPTGAREPAYETAIASDAQSPAASPPAKGKSQATSPAGSDSQEPTGELLATLQQLDRMAQQQIRGNTEQEQIEELLRIHSQRLALAKKAMTMNPSAEVRERLVMAMYEIHQRFAGLGVQGGMNQLVEFGRTMSADKDPLVARVGRHALFNAQLSRIFTQPTLDNGQEVVTEAKKLLVAEQDNLSEETEELLLETINLLTQRGFIAEVAELHENISGALSKVPSRAQRAADHALIARLLRMDVPTLLNNVMQGKADAEQKIVAAVKSLLAEVPPSPTLVNQTQSLAHILESTGHYAQSQECYDTIEATFKDNADPAIAKASLSAAKARQRVGLIGQPLAVEGVLPDGRPFDWSAYQGKVVLLDFWATWCGPCIEEIPNIRRNFEQFHAKGFEVVGVNLDTDAAQLKQFLTLQDLPWATVTSEDALAGKVPESEGFSTPMAAKCGVQGIPFVVLIGKDGKVDSIHVRGPKLKERLTALLGEPITTEVPADPTQAAPATSSIPSGGATR